MIDQFFVSIEARSSYKSRAIETGNNFLKGVVHADEAHPPIAVDNAKSLYYKEEHGCGKYVQEVYDNDNVTEAEAYKFTESEVWTDMIKGISDRTGVEVRMLLKYFPLSNNICSLDEP